MNRQRGESHDRRTLSPRAAFWSALLVFGSFAILWALANPLAAAPDEATHVAKAAGVVRGQMIGGELDSGKTMLALPRLYGEYAKYNDCFGFDPLVSASCVTQPEGDLTEITVVTTSASRYNPIYYAIVGLPTFLPPSTTVLYLVRIASALLCSAVLALGVRTAAELRAPAWVVAGIVVAATPMVMFLNSAVNPSSIEICAALSLWVVLLAALREPADGLMARRLIRAGVLVVLLVNAKALSPLFLAVIVLSSVAVSPRSSVVALVRDRRSWPGLGLGVLGAVSAVAWIALAGVVATPPWVSFPDLEPGTASDLIVRRTSVYLVNMLGQFGLVDTNMPIWTYVWIGACIGLVVMIALAVGSVRERAVILVLAVLVVALPLVLQLPQAKVLGLPWQGRYVLPVAVGLPILAGFVVAGKWREVPWRLSRSLVLMLASAMAFAQVVGFFTNLRRYVVGIEWPYFRAAVDPWAPPLPVIVLLGLAVAVCAASVLLVRALIGPAGSATGSGVHGQERPLIAADAGEAPHR